MITYGMVKGWTAKQMYEMMCKSPETLKDINIAIRDRVSNIKNTHVWIKCGTCSGSGGAFISETYAPNFGNKS